ncbi:MAG: hypothetical protein ACOYM7_06655, partial [Paludibacter sp.]
TKTKFEFKIKSLDEYSTLKIIPATFDSLLVFQLLDDKDKLLTVKKAAAKGTKFEFLRPGTYYLRAYMDINRNGKWDTGDISARRQPEDMFYYSKKLTLRANWEFEETWDVKAIPLLEQKPAELKKDGSKK